MKTTLLLSLLFCSQIIFSQQLNLVTGLNDTINETSGLLLINGKLITHNDSGTSPDLYEIDSITGYPESKVPKEYYLSINIELIKEEHSLYNLDWRFKDLEAYQDLKEKIRNPYKLAGTPFTTSLTKLMSVIKKD